MRRQGWNLRRDRSERPIVKALRKAGARVLLLDKFDLLVLYRGDLFMLDAKTGKGKGTVAQGALIADGWPLRYVADVQAALQAVGAAPDGPLHVCRQPGFTPAIHRCLGCSPRAGAR